MGQPATAIGVSEEAAGVSLDNTWTLLQLDGSTAGAIAPRERIFGGLLVIPMTSISGATTANIKVTYDAAGDIPITEIVSAQTIVTGETTATSGAVVATFNVPLVTDGAALYVWVQLDTGTATSGLAWFTWWV